MLFRQPVRGRGFAGVRGSGAGGGGGFAGGAALHGGGGEEALGVPEAEHAGVFPGGEVGAG